MTKSVASRCPSFGDEAGLIGIMAGLDGRILLNSSVANFELWKRSVGGMAESDVRGLVGIVRRVIHLEVGMTRDSSPECHIKLLRFPDSSGLLSFSNSFKKKKD